MLHFSAVDNTSFSIIVQNVEYDDPFTTYRHSFFYGTHITYLQDLSPIKRVGQDLTTVRVAEGWKMDRIK